MEEIVALQEATDHQNSLFLAGGISHCHDWQRELTALLESTDLILFNPRRENFPIDDTSAAREQIEWEFRHLRRAEAILFWFPPETLCPITLFELGTWSQSAKPLFVGVHSDYQRRADVEIQIHLARPDVIIVYSLPALARQVIDYASH